VSDNQKGTGRRRWQHQLGMSRRCCAPAAGPRACATGRRRPGWRSAPRGATVRR